jgi:hypothetical protein
MVRILYDIFFSVLFIRNNENCAKIETYIFSFSSKYGRADAILQFFAVSQIKKLMKFMHGLFPYK